MDIDWYGRGSCYVPNIVKGVFLNDEQHNNFGEGMFKFKFVAATALLAVGLAAVATPAEAAPPTKSTFTQTTSVSKVTEAPQV